MGPQEPNLPRNLAVVAVGAINQDQTVVVGEAGKVEDAEKFLRKAERKLELANEAYAAASEVEKAAKQRWDQQQADDTVVKTVPVPEQRGDRDL